MLAKGKRALESYSINLIKILMRIKRWCNIFSIKKSTFRSWRTWENVKNVGQRGKTLENVVKRGKQWKKAKKTGKGEKSRKRWEHIGKSEKTGKKLGKTGEYVGKRRKTWGNVLSFLKLRHVHDSIWHIIPYTN